MLLSIFKKCFVQTFRVPGRTRWVSFTNYTSPTPSDWIFSYQSWFFSNFKTSTSKLISHQGNFDIFFLTKEEDDAFRLIFRFWATLLLLRPLMTQRSLCGNFTFLSIFTFTFVDHKSNQNNNTLIQIKILLFQIPVNGGSYIFNHS